MSKRLMSKRLNRRKFLKSAAASSAIMAVGFPAIVRGAKKYEGHTLSVFTYAGAFESTVKNHLLKSFEARTGARVKLDAGWWDMLPKLKASPKGKPVYDVVITDPTQGYPSIKEGLFQKYDPANVPNAKKTHDGMAKNWVQADNWGANFSGSMMTMAMNTELVSNVPSHWHELLRDDLKGKLSFYNAPYMSLYTFAQMKAGMEGRPGQGREELAKDLDGVLKFCKDHRDIVRVWWTSTGDFIGKLLQKEVHGGVVHSSGAFPAEDGGKPVKSVVPDEGTASVHLFWSVTAGSKEKTLAEEWINQFFGTEFQVKWGSVGKLAVPNLEAAPMAGKENAFYKRFLPTTAADWDKIAFYPYDIYFEGDNWAKINDFWDRQVIRKS
jgi:putative spermidine/putrescine transport system substrate-binding protein